MDPFLIFLTIVITILSLVLVIAGIHVILILRNINHTLTKANNTLDLIEGIVHNLANPLSDLKSLGQGVRTGLQVAEHIASWVKEKKQKKQTDDQF